MIKKTILGVVLMVLALGLASAETNTEITFSQDAGDVEFSTIATLERTSWHDGVETAFVATDFSNEGSIGFHQEVTHYDPQGWFIFKEPSMAEYQYVEGTGDTEYNKHMEVWSTQCLWRWCRDVAYEGTGIWDTDDGIVAYEFMGDVSTREHTVFNYFATTDEDFRSESNIWINPFDVN